MAQAEKLEQNGRGVRPDQNAKRSRAACKGTWDMYTSDLTVTELAHILLACRDLVRSARPDLRKVGYKSKEFSDRSRAELPHYPETSRIFFKRNLM